MGDVDYGGFVGLKTDLQILNGFVGLKAGLQILRWICRPKGRPTIGGWVLSIMNDRPTISGCVCCGFG